MTMRLRLLVSALVLGILAACVGSDSPTAPPPAPPPPPNAELFGDLLDNTTETLTGTVSSLLSPFGCRTDGYGTVTRTIGSSGGVIRIGPHSLAIPPNALSYPRTITATAPAGNALRIDFEPAGLRFSKPTVLTISYRECPLPPLLPRIVYVDDDLNLLEILPTLNLTFSETVHAKVKHFSGYMVWE